jgi:hypothetical protein
VNSQNSSSRVSTKPAQLYAGSNTRSIQDEAGLGSLAFLEQFVSVFISFAPGQAFDFDPVSGAGAIRKVATLGDEALKVPKGALCGRAPYR